ncbi:MAG: hypothetical protein OQK51_03265 [Kangiellaceae bacterium]|nr:hypothetical protein [Kangiellaceae bacterium]
MNKNIFLILWLSFFFLGCATTPMKKEALQPIQIENKPLNLFMINSGNDLMVEKIVYTTSAPVYTGGSTGGTFIGGGISGGNIALENAESLLEEFEGLIDFGKSKLDLIEAQQNAIQAKSWLNIQSTEQLRHKNRVERKIGDLGLYVTTDYVFNLNLSKLRAYSEVKLIKTEKKGEYARKTYTKDKVLYKKTFQYESPAVNLVDKSEKEIAQIRADIVKEIEEKEAKVRNSERLSRTEKHYQLAKLKKKKKRVDRQLISSADEDDNLENWKSDGAKKVKIVLENAHKKIIKQIEQDFRIEGI